MDAQTRYRVTGSLFLLAVAVILFPMLFDGAGLETVQIEPLEVPQSVPEVASRLDRAPDSDLMARAEALAEDLDEDGFQNDANGTRIGEPVLSEAGENTRVWAVQVASFQEEENALKLRDELRRREFEAFITTVKRGESVLHRVAVGPLLDREAADSLRDELSGALALDDVRVVAFSN